MIAGDLTQPMSCPPHYVLKCRLKPVAAEDYGTVSFSTDQWSRLQAAFPTGVCDWSKRGVAQERARPWATYARGPTRDASAATPASR